MKTTFLTWVWQYTCSAFHLFFAKPNIVWEIREFYKEVPTFPALMNILVALLSSMVLFGLLLIASVKKMRSITSSEVSGNKIFWIWQALWLGSFLFSTLSAILLLCFLEGVGFLDLLMFVKDGTFIWLGLYLSIPVVLLGLLVNKVLYYFAPNQYISELKGTTETRTSTFLIVEVLYLLFLTMLTPLLLFMAIMTLAILMSIVSKGAW